MFLGLVIVFQNYKVVFTGGFYVGAGFLLLVTQHNWFVPICRYVGVSDVSSCSLRTSRADSLVFARYVRQAVYV